jgi:hypothetical protein
MTTLSETTMPPEPTPPAPPPPTGGPPGDHRGSVIPGWRMIAMRFMELRRRRGLMITLAVVTIGLPSIFLAIRLIAHAVDPKAYGPAGGYDIFTALVAGVLYVFGFIVAATLGCTAGSVDLGEGVFRHLVVTGRSRVAIYFARIPAGLGIILPLVATGYGLVCLVCSVAAPTQLSYNGVNVPAGLSRPALVSWADHHYGEVVCNFGLRIGPKGGPGGNIPIPCGPNGFSMNNLPPGSARPTTAQLQSLARLAANQDYADYSKQFLSPPIGLMVRTGLWIELEAAIGFLVGLGLGSLIGQRTVSVVLMIVLEVILTPIFLRAQIPHLLNFQRSIVGVAMDHLGPSAMPIALGGGGGGDHIVSETRPEAVLVVVAWIVFWTAIGAWRMATRDA